MKRLKFVKQFVAKSKNILINWLGSLLSFAHSCFLKGVSHFNHYLSLFFLNNKIGQRTLAQMFNAVREYSPFIGNAFAVIGHLFCSIRRKFSTKIINKPVDKNLIGTGNLNSGVEMGNAGFFAKGITAYDKATFSIKNTCKISQLSNSVVFFNVVADHMRSFTINSILLVYRELKPA